MGGRGSKGLDPQTVGAGLETAARQVVALLREAGSGAGVAGPPGGAGSGPGSGAALAAIRLAGSLRGRADDALVITVGRARQSGHTWQEIGEALGTTRQAAFQRFGRPIDPRTGETMNQHVLPNAGDRAIGILAAWSEGRYDDVAASGFDATLTEKLPPEAIASAWAQIAGMVGAYQHMGEPFSRQLGDYTVVDVEMNFESGPMKGRVAFNRDGKVSGLFILNPDTP